MICYVVIGTLGKMKQGKDITITGEENAVLPYFYRMIKKDLPEKKTLEQRLEEMRS